MIQLFCLSIGRLARPLRELSEMHANKRAKHSGYFLDLVLARVQHTGEALTLFPPPTPSRDTMWKSSGPSDPGAMCPRRDMWMHGDVERERDAICGRDGGARASYG